MSKPWAYFRICSIVVVIGLTVFFLNRGGAGTPPSGDRNEYLRRAKVWHSTDVSRADILAGPQSAIAVPLDQEVLCRYIEGKSGDFGATPKFKCALYDTGEVVRIKYNRRETYAEVAANRLLWSLGFYADENYPVRLRCMDCPAENPAAPAKEERRMERILDDAIMERKFAGIQIERYEDQGWNWQDLDTVDSRIGGASRAELDALKLLAVFLQHTDSKASQQRLACYEENIRHSGRTFTCDQPILMLQDLGATFGIGSPEVNASSSAYLKGWKRAKIWNHSKELEYLQRTGRKACFGNLTSASNDGLFDPEISEEGRAFLSQLLNQLSDRQIADFFRVARIERLNEQIDGHTVTIEDWTATFKEKRREIESRRCQ